jgi:anti-sigma regulatory factor (Ser/Thr protein kinase)
MVTSALTRPVELPPQPTAARRELSRLLGDARWEGDTDAVVLAVHEAMVNAQRHAGGVTHAEARFDGQALVVEVADRGAGFQLPTRTGVPDVDAERGRGLFLIQELTEDVRVVRAGPEVCLQLRFER